MLDQYWFKIRPLYPTSDQTNLLFCKTNKQDGDLSDESLANSKANSWLEFVGQRVGSRDERAALETAARDAQLTEDEKKTLAKFLLHSVDTAEKYYDKRTQQAKATGGAQVVKKLFNGASKAEDTFKNLHKDIALSTGKKKKEAKKKLQKAVEVFHDDSDSEEHVSSESDDCSLTSMRKRSLDSDSNNSDSCFSLEAKKLNSKHKKN